MDKYDVFAVINEAKIPCFLATVDGDVPRVRGMMPYRADENGIIFHTGVMKDLHKQLQKNPNVEICLFNHVAGWQVRISGSAELVSDKALKEEIVARRDFLKPWVAEKGMDILAVYRIKNATATFWTMATNFAPREYINL